MSIIAPLGTPAEFVFPETGAPVRTMTINGEPWFVGTDAAAALGLGDARKSLNLLDEDDRNTIPVIDAMGREQHSIVINEPGLYSLVLRSRKPQAKAFKRWVTHEVIPSIRKTGSYALPELPQQQQLVLPRSLPDALRALAVELELNDELTATIAKLSPKAQRADQYEANPGITPTVFHKMHFPKVGERAFFEHLYRKDYLIDQRNARWDERKQEWKPGPEHMHPTAKGKRYFYLQPTLDRGNVRREQTLVIPGDAEHDLVAALERDGLPSLHRPALPGADVIALRAVTTGGAA